MKKSIYALLCIHLVVFIIACDNSDKPDIAVCPAGTYVSTTGTTAHNDCKNFYNRSLNESAQLKTVGDNLLQITHLDAVFNCAPGQITFTCQAGEGLILVQEKETSNAANCVCPYDLTYTVELTGEGAYALYINEYKFGEFEFTPTTNLTLAKLLTPGL